MRSASPHRRSIGACTIGVLFCTFFLTCPAQAAEELFVTAGSPITIGAETDLVQPTYSWVLSMNGQILETRVDRFFHGIIPTPGVATLELTIRSAAGEEELKTIVVRSEQPVSIDPASSSIVRAILRTVPPMSAADHRVALPQEGGVLVLHLDESTGAIREYHVDTNTMVDSDGDGTPDNDADNRIHPSFFEGGSFPISVVSGAGETERTMQLRVFGTNGELSDARIAVTFDPVIPLTPILRTIPLQDSAKQAVVLPAEGGIILFDASDSTGGVQSYALDLDLDRDTDADGNPANDNDVAGAAFERTGEAIAILLRPRGTSARKIGLTITNRNAQSNTITLPVFFGENALLPIPPVQGGNDIRLVSSIPSPVVAQEFSLTVEGASAQTSLYEWDLQSDGQTDTTTAIPTLLLRPDAPGVLPVRVILRDAAGAMLGIAQAEFNVQSSPSFTGEEVPESGEEESLRIDTTIEGNAVSFQPVIDPVLDLMKIYSTWDFGDGTKSYLLMPTHEYAEAGTYEVRLSLTDAVTGRGITFATSSVTVRATTAPSETPSAGGTIGAIFRALGFMFKVALFVFLLLLIISAVALGFFFITAKNEGISLKEKLRTYMSTLRGEEVESVVRPVTEIIEAASMPKKLADEPAPMKLVAEEVSPPTPKPSPPPQVPPQPKVPPTPPAPPSPTPTVPTPPKAPVALQAESAQLPPWLKSSHPSPSLQPQSVPSLQNSPVQPQPPTPRPPTPPLPKTPPVVPPISPPPQPTPTPQVPSVPAPVIQAMPPPVPKPSLPPTTQAPTSASSVSPKSSLPPPPKKPTSVSPTSPKPSPPPSISPSTTTPVPAWLQQGMEKSQEKDVAQSGPILPQQTAEPPDPSMPASLPELEVPDDEPIAMLRAELPEEEDRGATPAHEAPNPKEQT